MSDYTPIDLSSVANAGPEIFGPTLEPKLGPQDLRGIPFLIGEDEEAAFVTVGAGTPCPDGVVLPVAGQAQRVLFAHAVLDSGLFDGEPLGQTVAEYVFHYVDGEVERVPIRERYEVAAPPYDFATDYPLSWGQLPFEAVASENETFLPRLEGPWGEAGERQCGAMLGWAESTYYLWAWHNPRPEQPLARISVEPAGRRLLIAAVTVGTVAENPFDPGPRRDVVVTLPREEDARREFDLTVEVDRGLCNYAYALPAASAEEFLGEPFAGWGQPPNEASSPAYAQVLAVPSATLVVRLGEDELGRVNWGDLCEAGELSPGERLGLRVKPVERTWVRTTVRDAETGEVQPCRIHFRSVEGIPYAPHGHHAHVNSELGSFHLDVGGDLKLGQATYAYIDGSCEGWLPEGEILVDVACGFEYEPLRTRVTIEPGQRELSLSLRRFADLPGDGIHAADTHAHFLSTAGAHLEARGEGLAIANVLMSQWAYLYTNTEEFRGRPDVADDGRTVVYVGQENRQHMLGHISLLGLKETIMPWCSDGLEEDELGGSLEATLSHWADACHAQGGLVIVPHFPSPNCEPATLIASGRADAVEMIAHHSFCHEEYYRYLNCGYRLPLVAGTDKMTSDVPLGLMRTYAKLGEGEELSYEAWQRAVVAGRTFASSGPLLELEVDGASPGETIGLDPDGGTVQVRARVRSILPVHSLQILCNGEVVASEEESAGADELVLETTVPVAGDGWIAARSGGPGYETVKHRDSWRRGIMAHTSPVYLACGEGYAPFDPKAGRYLESLIEGGLAYVRARVASPQAGLVTGHPHVEDDHLAYLEAPFVEALAALRARGG